MSANLGTAGSGSELGQGGAGQLPATSAFGGTSNLVSLDALEEFRIQTSTFAPEYGRTPALRFRWSPSPAPTRFTVLCSSTSATTCWMPTIGSPTANGLARPELRQNDFGGVLGGPIRRRSAKNAKLFFFGSYEGLRVRQPNVADTFVPRCHYASERTSSRPAASQRLPITERAGLRQRHGGIYGQLLRSLHAEFLRHPDRLSAVAKRDVFGRYSDAPSAHRSARAQGFSYSSVQDISTGRRA